MGALQACAMTDLYIMERSDAPGIIKVGSSQDPERRRRQLEEGHTFRMSVVAVFPGAGQFEHCVHRKLAYARVMTGAGREWYRLPPSVAFQAAADIVFPPTTLQKAVVGPTPPPCWEEFAWRGIPGSQLDAGSPALPTATRARAPARPTRPAPTRPDRPAGSAARHQGAPHGAGSAARYTRLN